MRASSPALRRILRQRAVLAVTGTVALLQGIVGTVSPELVTTALDYQLGAFGRVEFRATYGGFFLGMAAFLGLAAFWPRLRPGALAMLACGAGGAAAVRILALSQSGAISPPIVLFLIYELAVLAAALFVMPRRSGAAAVEARSAAEAPERGDAPPTGGTGGGGPVA